MVVTREVDAGPPILTGALVKLTFGKATVNTAIRWLPLFLPTLAVTYNSSEATLAVFLGLAETAGLTTLVVARWLKAGRERAVIIAALLSIVVSSALALTGELWLLAAAMLILGGASAHIAVSGHAWISARVGFAERARFIGIYEISWACALLIGVPMVAVLIEWFGWRGPFIAIAVLAVVAASAVAGIDDGQRAAPSPATNDPGGEAIPTDAWLIIGASAAIALCGLSMIAVTGTWLNDAFNVSTEGIGLVAISFGVAELLASATSSALADQLGKRRSTQAAVLCTLVGLLIVASAATTVVLGVIGLVIFFLGFEFAIVTSFSLVSEAMPDDRGRALGTGYAVSTLLRGVGVALSGLLYAAFDIQGSVLMACIGAISALTFLTILGPKRPEL